MNTIWRIALGAVLAPFVAQVPAAAAAGGSAPVDGSGKVAEEVRPIAGFTGVVVKGAIDVVLKAAPAERVIIRADDNLLPLIETTVVGQSLVLDTRRNTSFRSRNPLRVTVEYKEMNSVTVRGSGDVRGETVQATAFAVSIRGSGDVLLERLEASALAVSIAGSGDLRVRSGHADSLGVVIEGSGDVLLDGLETREAAIRVRGSGDARVFVTQTLQVDIAGSGDVRYKGAPRIGKRVSGSGEVSPLR